MTYYYRMVNISMIVVIVRFMVRLQIRVRVWIKIEIIFRLG